MLLLELYLRQASGGVEAAFRVVEHLDVIEHVTPDVFAGGVDAAADTFALEQMEEGLGHCVVMAVAPSAHAANQIVVAQEVLPVMSGVLTALNVLVIKASPNQALWMSELVKRLRTTSIFALCANGREKACPSICLMTLLMGM